MDVCLIFFLNDLNDHSNDVYVVTVNLNDFFDIYNHLFIYI